MADENERPWWQGAAIYQIYPRSFQDSNGDGIGDLPGITRRLPYVAELGVDAIWLSPFYPSPLRDFGYDITEHCEVADCYGTMGDFDALLERAHGLGLKVIVDAVLNHTSHEHEWFQESRSSRDNPKADWYQWSDPKPDGSPPNNWISRYGASQWCWCPVRAQYYRHQYLSSQPALNLANEDVVAARLEVLDKWLARGVDGLRFDAVCQYYAAPDLCDNGPADPCDDDLTTIGPYNPFAWQCHDHDCNGDRTEAFLVKIQDQVVCAGCTFTFAEIDIRLNCYQSLGRYTGDGGLNAAYTPDFMEAHPLPSNFVGVLNSAREHAGMDRLVWTATNHDASRLATRWAPQDADDETRGRVSKLAVALLCCLEGQIGFFQGEELGLPDAPYDENEILDPQGRMFWPKGRGRDPIRHPMPWDESPQAGFSDSETTWLPLKDPVLVRHAAGQEGDRDSVLSTWQQLLRLRRETPALRHGRMEIDAADDETGLLRLTRTEGDVSITAVFNLSSSPMQVGAAGGEVLAGTEGAELGAWSWRIACA